MRTFKLNFGCWLVGALVVALIIGALFTIVRRVTAEEEEELERLVAQTDNDVLRQVTRTWMKESFADAESIMVGMGMRSTWSKSDTVIYGRRKDLAFTLFEGRIRLAAAHTRDWER